MKRSNSTGMITDLLSVTEREGQTGRRNSIGTGLKGKRLLSASNASLPGDVTLCLPWTSPVKLQIPVPHLSLLQPLSSPLSFMRINSPTSRVVQLRKEESVDERLREAEQDREVTSQIQLNQSWSELKLDDDEIRPEMMETLPCPVSMTTSMQFTSPSSPIIASRVRSRSLTPTSPSSSRTFTYRRSLSPAPLRPSSLCFQPQRKRQRNSDPNEEMDISPTQLHPPAKRAVFQSPLTVPTSCNSPLLTTQVTQQDAMSLDSKEERDTPLQRSRPAFDTPTQFPAFNNHSAVSYSHTPLNCLSDVRKHANYPSGHTHNHQCIESAFQPFKRQGANGMTTPTSIMSEQMSLEDSHFDPLLNPVTTIS